jgi:hypothetical protein
VDHKEGENSPRRFQDILGAVSGNFASDELPIFPREYRWWNPCTTIIDLSPDNFTILDNLTALVHQAAPQNAASILAIRNRCGCWLLVGDFEWY